jgi:hypothetical protein
MQFGHTKGSASLFQAASLDGFLQLPHLYVARNYFGWVVIWQSNDTYQTRTGSTSADVGHKLLIDVQVQVVTTGKDGDAISLVKTGIDSGRTPSLQ